jgi:hypothetical protein
MELSERSHGNHSIYEQAPEEEEGMEREDKMNEVSWGVGKSSVVGNMRARLRTECWNSTLSKTDQVWMEEQENEPSKGPFRRGAPAPEIKSALISTSETIGSRSSGDGLIVRCGLMN